MFYNDGMRFLVWCDMFLVWSLKEHSVGFLRGGVQGEGATGEP